MCTEVKLSKFSFRIHVPVITYIAKSRVFIPSVDCSHSSSCFPSARSLHQQSPAASTDGMRVTPLNTWSNTNCWVHSVHDVTTNSIPVTVTKYYRNFDTSNEFSLTMKSRNSNSFCLPLKSKFSAYLFTFRAARSFNRHTGNVLNRHRVCLVLRDTSFTLRYNSSKRPFRLHYCLMSISSAEWDFALHRWFWSNDALITAHGGAANYILQIHSHTHANWGWRRGKIPLADCQYLRCAWRTDSHGHQQLCCD